MRPQYKTDILLNALSERYKSIHLIRERIQTVSIWILGLLIAGAAWVYQSNIYFTQIELLGILITIIFIWFCVYKFYLSDLVKGFNGQRKIAAKIEKNLGFYSKRYFSEEEESLYSEEWKNSGKEKSEGRFVRNTYFLLAIGFILLIISISTHLNSQKIAKTKNINERLVVTT